MCCETQRAQNPETGEDVTSDEEIKYTSNFTDYDTFKSFTVKVVMTSNNVTVVPKIRDIRTIALD